MRRVLAIALATLAAPAMALAAHPYKEKNLDSGPTLDKSLIAHQRARKAQRHAARSAAPAAIPGYLAAIAACESGGNPSAIGGSGLDRGMFQMTISTWQSLGGRGDPAGAPIAEQVRRAEALYAQAGPGQWPVCGQ